MDTISVGGHRPYHFHTLAKPPDGDDSQHTTVVNATSLDTALLGFAGRMTGTLRNAVNHGGEIVVTICRIDTLKEGEDKQ